VTTADHTAGQLTIVETTAPPGFPRCPLHVHHPDDEGFWILEGDLTFEVGDATIEASVHMRGRCCLVRQPLDYTRTTQALPGGSRS
jgi:mannose-6-phosphate isomerase-like protein (cupin superfamily)